MALNTQPDRKEDEQANELRSLFYELEQINEEEKSTVRDETQIDVLNLPPRKEVHGKNSRTKLKLSKPFLRLFIVIVIILFCIVLALYLGEGDISSFMHRL